MFHGRSRDDEEGIADLKNSGMSDSRILEFGHLEIQEKNDALAACDVFCLPSVSESFGIALIEAWHFGKPVVACDIPSSRELINACDGGLIVAQEPERIGAAILTLLRDPGRIRLTGLRGREMIKRYAANEVAAGIQKVYDALVVGALPHA